MNVLTAIPIPQTPVNAGPMWDSNGIINPTWMRWANAVTVLLQAIQNSGLQIDQNGNVIITLKLTVEGLSTLVGGVEGGETVILPLAPLTGGGSQGSVTFTNGIETAHILPTA